MREPGPSTKEELQERLSLERAPSLDGSTNQAVTAVQFAMKGLLVPPRSPVERVRSANTSRIMNLLVEQAG